MLTRQEYKILRLVLFGYEQQEVAKRLSLNTATVSRSLDSVERKNPLLGCALGVIKKVHHQQQLAEAVA
ncbi:hypothetical protein LCGC14_0297700 [marine sediment metagenome]|uniref:HTH luxR-type domain-containing protein n=1 Tax=marine sediment metagenome TaxID=412755 RepID=A0A0F9WCH9_9ZZZZ